MKMFHGSWVTFRSHFTRPPGQLQLPRVKTRLTLGRDTGPCATFDFSVQTFFLFVSSNQTAYICISNLLNADELLVIVSGRSLPATSQLQALRRS